MGNAIELAEAPKQDVQVGTADLLFQPGMMQALEHFAIQMSKGKATLPAHLQGNPADCMAVTIQAAQWRMSPNAVAQKTHLVNGTLGYEAQLVNAVVSSSRAIVGRFKYQWEGETKCRAGAVLAGETDITWGLWVDADKQAVKNSPLWKTDPAQQLAYLAVKKWARLYTPDVILGVYTPDELEQAPVSVRDMGAVQLAEDTPTQSRSASVKERVKQKQAAAKQEPEPADVDPETGEVIEQQSGPTYEEVMRDLANCQDEESFAGLRDVARTLYGSLDQGQKTQMTKAINALEGEFAGSESESGADV